MDAVICRERPQRVKTASNRTLINTDQNQMQMEKEAPREHVSKQGLI